MPILIMASELHKDIRKVYVSQISTSTTAPTTLTVTTVSTNNLLTVNSTISNLNLSTSTISNINATNTTSTNFIGSNATLTNSVFTTLTSGTINFTTAIGSTGITIPSLLATTSISSASIQGTNITITNSNFTNLTSSTINFTNAIGTTSTIGTIRSTNVISTNLSSSTINATGSTVGTFNVTGMSTLQNTTVTNQTLSTLNATTGITTGTLLATSIQATNIISSNTSSGILRFTTAVGSTGLTTGIILATTSISTGQMASTNLSTSTINATGGTIGTLNITGTSTLQNTTATNQTLATLNATIGITTATLLATTSISTGQFTSNNISSGTINVATGITTSTLLATSSISTGQLASANISTTNLYVTTLITGSNLGVNNLTTGTLRVSSTRGILIGSSTDIDNGRLISAHNNTLGSGGQTYITLGVGASANNQSEFSFAYFTSGSTLNRTSIGLFGSPNTLSILGTGNVGVGNTNPSYKLDVSGDMRATGNIYLGGGNIYPNTNITTSSNLALNVYGGTLTVNGPMNLAGYGINAAGTSTLGNIVSIGSGNVGIGVAAPNSILQVGAAVDIIYANNALTSNRINIFGPARASPTYAGTSDMNGTLFINSTSAYGRNVGASIALGGRGYNFAGGNAHMTFARINGVQATDRDTYDGNFVIETQAAGSMYERLRIMQDGNIGIGTTNPLYLLDVNGTIDAVAYTGANINISGSIQAGGNIGAIGNLTNGGYDFILGNANQVARGNSGASRALVKDGAASLIMNYSGDFTGGVEVQGNFFRTIGNSNTIGNIFTTGGNLGIGTGTPSNRLHVHNSAASQDVRIILSDATTTVSSSRGFHMIKNGSQHGYLWNYENGFLQLGTNNTPVITMTGGNVGIGTATPTQIMHIQRSGSDNYLKIDAGGGASNLSGIMLSEHNINFGWSLRHDAGTDLLYISYQDNTPSFTNTTIFNRSGQIGINKTPGYTLDINGNRLNLHNAAGTGGGQNLFEGLANENQRAQIVISGMYSDMVIASSQANDNHGSTLTFASYNPSNKADYRKWVINQGNWGARVHMLEFGYNPNNQPNPHEAINDTYTTMTLDGVNDRVGISNRSPGFKLDVNGDFRAYGGRYIIQNTQDGGTGRGIYMWQESDQNWAIYMGTSGAGRSFSGGTATTGVYGFASHAVRFRAFNNSSSPANGWIFENSQEGHAASIRSDGHMYIAGNLGLGVISPAYRLDVSGSVQCSDWFRSLNNTGWYNQTHGRGIYMTDSTWVRTYPDRSAFLCGTLNCYDITTNSNSISIGSGTMYLSANGAGLNWGSSFSQIYDSGHLIVATDDNMYFNVNGSTRMYINSSGQVGHGTTGPESGIHLSGSTSIASISMQTSGRFRYYVENTGNANCNMYWDATGRNGNAGDYSLQRCAMIENDRVGDNVMNFTGQHRSYVKDTSIIKNYEKDYVGLIAIATNEHISLIDFEPKRGKDAITISEAIPIIDLCTQEMDKRVFGVISDIEDQENEYRNMRYGNFVSVNAKQPGDNRTFVNSLGEGGIWVSNANGTLENGDYICSSNIPGYGMKQNSDLLHNYTVAKITMDCNFEPLLKPKLVIKTKSITETTEEIEYEETQQVDKKEQLIWDDTRQMYVQTFIDEITTLTKPKTQAIDVYDPQRDTIKQKTIEITITKTTTKLVNDLDDNGNIQWIPLLDESGNNVYEYEYDLRYLLPDGTIITKLEYDNRKNNNEQVYIAAFVGCTYHCG